MRAAMAALDKVGLAKWWDHTPAELSGGQQQRVAIARAIVTSPDVLLADEPTGNLDSERSVEIMELLSGLNRDAGITVLMVTHEPDMAAFARTIVHFKDGLVERIDSKHHEGEKVSRGPTFLPPPRVRAAAGVGSRSPSTRRSWKPGAHPWPRPASGRGGRLMLATTFLLAIRSILRHKLRSFLTTLGIIIGVGAVVTMVTLGQATTAEVQKQISALGTNVLQVRPGQGFGRGGGEARPPDFKPDDVTAIKDQIAGVTAVAPRRNRPRRRSMRARTGRPRSTAQRSVILRSSPGR